MTEYASFELLEARERDLAAGRRPSPWSHDEAEDVALALEAGAQRDRADLAALQIASLVAA